MIWNRLKIICEPSCAVTLAVARKYKQIFKDKKVAAILTGGNVDLEDTKSKFSDILESKLEKDLKEQ